MQGAISHGRSPDVAAAAAAPCDAGAGAESHVVRSALSRSTGSVGIELASKIWSESGQAPRRRPEGTAIDAPLSGELADPAAAETVKCSDIRTGKACRE